MSRRKEIDRKRELRDAISKGKKSPATKPKKEKPKKKADAADVNKDGKVDEKDLSLVEKAMQKAKKIVKKK